MASFWGQNLLDENDESDCVASTSHTQNSENISMMDTENRQHSSESTGSKKNIAGGVIKTGQFDFEKRIFELEEQLEHTKAENKMLKNELQQMRQINLQLRRETNESLVDQRFINLTDLWSCRESAQKSGQNNIHSQKQLEERLMGLEKRLDKLEKNESKDPRLYPKPVEHPMNEYCTIGDDIQTRKIRDENIFASEIDEWVKATSVPTHNRCQIHPMQQNTEDESIDNEIPKSLILGEKSKAGNNQKSFRAENRKTDGDGDNMEETEGDKIEDLKYDDDTGSEDDGNVYEGDHGWDNSSGYKKEKNPVTKYKFRGRGFSSGSSFMTDNMTNMTSGSQHVFHLVRDDDSEDDDSDFEGDQRSDKSSGYKKEYSPVTETNFRGRGFRGSNLLTRGMNKNVRPRPEDGFHNVKEPDGDNSPIYPMRGRGRGNFSGKMGQSGSQMGYCYKAQFTTGEKETDTSSRSLIGRGHCYIQSGARGGRGGSTFTWGNASQKELSKLDNQLDLQEESINVDNNEMVYNEPRFPDISKPFVSGNLLKFDHSQMTSEERNKQLQNVLDKEKAKSLNSKPTKQTIETTLLQVELLKTSFSDFKDCIIQFDAQNKVLILYGPESVIRECQLKLMLEMKKIKEETINISSDMKSILSREKGKKYLKDLNSSGLNGAKVAIDDFTLLLAAKEERILSEAFKMLKCKLDFVELVKSEVVIPNDRLISLKYHIEHGLLVHVTFDDTGKIIKLLGIEDDVLMARQDVEKLLEEFGVYKKSFNVVEPEARFMHFCCEDILRSCLKSVYVSLLSLTETKVSIRYEGSKSETSQAYRNLQDLRNNIMSHTWNLLDDFKKHELFLLGNSLKSGPMKEKLDTYKYKEKTLVIPKFPNFYAKLLSASKKKNSPDKTKMPKSRAQDSRPVPQVHSANKLVCDISTTCQLVIKPYGDIIKEKSDILVSILGPEMDMRKTTVGCVFNKTCPSHWKELQIVKDSNPNAPVLTVKNPRGLKCLAVCHVILSIWNPSTSPQQLNVAIQTVLNEAKILGAKSVSFPALGCGRAFQFPPLNVAQQVLTSIGAMNVGTFLNKVVLLAPDKELFKALKSEVPNHFNAASPKHLPAPPPPPPPAPTVAKEESDEETDDSESSDDGFEVSNLNDKKDSNAPQFIIITLHGNKTFEAIKKIIMNDIRDICLQVDYFNQNIMNHWPGESRKKILKEAMKLSVWAERSIHPKTKHVGFQLTGEKAAVIQVKAFIDQEFLAESSHLPKRSLTSDQVPRRRTVDFMRYAADSDELFPSYWSLNKSKSFWKDLRNKFSNKQKKLLVDVDKETKDAITNLVTKTLDINLVGHGNDAVGIQYSSLKVLDVKRVENPELFERYQIQRKRLFEKMVRRGHICPDIGKLRGSKGRVCTTELLSDSMKKELYYEINEHYLFHGTKSDTIDALIHNGLDPRLSNEAAMFGKAIYAAERATKSDQYTDSKQQRTRNGTKLTLILTRMLLGNVFLCDDNHKSVQGKGSKKLSRPPCMSCSEDVCKCKDQTLFDSVMGDGKWLFREFVVYESSQCYPEYVITYTRV